MQAMILARRWQYTKLNLFAFLTRTQGFRNLAQWFRYVGIRLEYNRGGKSKLEYTPH